MSKVFELLRIAELAKDNSGGQYYGLSNLAFALLLQEWIVGNPSVQVTLETEDVDGNHMDEVYFDLIVIHVAGHSTCIPLPLLDAQTVAILFKGGLKMTPRETHCREVGETNPTRMRFLWRRLFKETSRKERKVAKRHLLKYAR